MVNAKTSCAVWRFPEIVTVALASVVLSVSEIVNPLSTTICEPTNEVVPPDVVTTGAWLAANTVKVLLLLVILTLPAASVAVASTLCEA